MIEVISVKQNKPPVKFEPIEILLKITKIEELEDLKRAIGSTPNVVGDKLYRELSDLVTKNN